MQGSGFLTPAKLRQARSERVYQAIVQDLGALPVDPGLPPVDPGLPPVDPPDTGNPGGGGSIVITTLEPPTIDFGWAAFNFIPPYKITLSSYPIGAALTAQWAVGGLGNTRWIFTHFASSPHFPQPSFTTSATSSGFIGFSVDGGNTAFATAPLESMRRSHTLEQATFVLSANNFALTSDRVILFNGTFSGLGFSNLKIQFLDAPPVYGFD